MNIKVMLWYDVEDYITKEADDALDLLIDMMDRRGIISSLKIVADKARVLRKRGRYDIIKKMSGHEICYHTENHSKHPTVTEYLEGYGFADGAEEFERQESKGFRDVLDITGQFATSYGQAGAAWASQVFPVLRKWGVPTYLDSHDIIDVDGKPFWYGGILNLTRLSATMRMSLKEESDLETAKKEFDRLIADCPAEENLLISIYYHPCEFSCTEFWDGVNFRNGKNVPAYAWKPSKLRPDGEMAALVDRLGEFIDYTLVNKDVEYISASQAVGLEIRGAKKLCPESFRDFARSVGSKISFAQVDGNWYAPSELMSLMERYITGRHMKPSLSYGPERHIPSEIHGPVKASAMAAAFRDQYSLVLGYRQLPDLYEVEGNRINPADMYIMMAQAIAGGEDYIEAAEGTLVSDCINGNDNWGKKWIIFSEELKVPETIRMAKLQAWTLKPARF